MPKRETPDQQRRRLRAEIEQVGRDTMIRMALERSDAHGLAALLEILGRNDPDAIDLLTKYVLVHHGLGHDTADAWRRRAADYLWRLIGQPPLPSVLVN
jgi:hypothetical protein